MARFSLKRIDLIFWTSPRLSVSREQDTSVLPAGYFERFLDLTHTHIQYCRNP